MHEASGPGEQPRRGHETRDASIRNLIIFGIGLSLMVIAGLLISRAVFDCLVGHQELGPPASPFENVRTLPPAPRLQVRAPRDLNQYKAEQDEILNNYGWVDQQSGTVRIPVERAMDILLQRGFPVRGATPAKQAAPNTSRQRAEQVVGRDK